MKTEKCKICGTEIERKGPGCKPKYCDVCRAERRRASQRKTYHKKEEQRKAQEAMHKLAPARSLSMNELLRELEQFNAKRRQMGAGSGELRPVCGFSGCERGAHKRRNEFGVASTLAPVGPVTERAVSPQAKWRAI